MKKYICLFLAFTIFGQVMANDSLDSVFSKPADFTDDQVKKAEEFKHKGRTKRLIEEACEEQGIGTCAEEDLDKKTTVFGDSDFAIAVEQNIGKLFGVLQLAALAKGGKDGKKTGDFCGIAALGYEAIAAGMQSAQQAKIEEKAMAEEDPQIQTLVALKETHLTRKKTAGVQRTIYAATASCYIANASFTNGFSDPATYLKIAAAGGLTALYWVKSRKHKKAADLVQNVINSLPKEGNCNPWTDTKCFCAEASSKTKYASLHQEVCVLNKGNIDTPKMAMGCGAMNNGTVTFDKDCKCKATNTCFQANLRTFNPKFSMAKNFMNEANKGFEMLSSGNYDEGEFNEYSLKAGTFAQRAAEKLTPKPGSIPSPKLTLEDQKIADSLKGVVPPAVAGFAAGVPSVTPPSGATDFAKSADAVLAKVPEELKKKINEVEIQHAKKGGSNKNKGDAPGFVMPDFKFGGEEKKGSNTEVISFAEKAIQQADVNKTPDVPIFDIISNRYRHSWKRFESQEKIHSPKESN